MTPNKRFRQLLTSFGRPSFLVKLPARLYSLVSLLPLLSLNPTKYFLMGFKSQFLDQVRLANPSQNVPEWPSQSLDLKPISSLKCLLGKKGVEHFRLQQYVQPLNEFEGCQITFILYTIYASHTTDTNFQSRSCSCGLNYIKSDLDLKTSIFF